MGRKRLVHPDAQPQTIRLEPDVMAGIDRARVDREGRVVRSRAEAIRYLLRNAIATRDKLNRA